MSYQSPCFWRLSRPSLNKTRQNLMDLLIFLGHSESRNVRNFRRGLYRGRPQHPCLRAAPCGAWLACRSVRTGRRGRWRGGERGGGPRPRQALAGVRGGVGGGRAGGRRGGGGGGRRARPPAPPRRGGGRGWVGVGPPPLFTRAT